MAIKMTNGAEFLHIPKTGGSWITEFLKKNHLIQEYQGHKHADFDRNLYHDRLGAGRDLMKKVGEMLLYRLKGQVYEPQDSAPFRFCFVRHPLSWYESWWKFMKPKNFHDWGKTNSVTAWHPNSVLNGTGDSDFNTCIRNIVQKRPGYVSEMLFSYVKPGISFIGKNEYLKEDLKTVLDHLGVQYDVKALGMERVNVSDTAPSEVVWDPELKKIVMRLELPALIQFGYVTPDELSELGIYEPISAHPALRKVLI